MLLEGAGRYGAWLRQAAPVDRWPISHLELGEGLERVRRAGHSHPTPAQDNEPPGTGIPTVRAGEAKTAQVGSAWSEHLALAPSDRRAAGGVAAP